MSGFGHEHSTHSTIYFWPRNRDEIQWGVEDANDLPDWNDKYESDDGEGNRQAPRHLDENEE